MIVIKVLHFNLMTMCDYSLWVLIFLYHIKFVIVILDKNARSYDLGRKINDNISEPQQ